MKLLAPFVFPVVLLAAAASAQSTVHVVDDDGGAGVAFTDLQTAVTQAGEGDTLLVRDGTYGGVQATGKSLVIAADAGAAVRIVGSLTVSGLAGTQSFAVRGVEVRVPLFNDAVLLSGNLGAVAFEDCRITSFNLGQFGDTPAGVVVENCAKVAFVRWHLEGSLAGLPGGGGDGLIARSSSVHLYDSIALGGEGAIGGSVPGGDGVILEDAFLFASGSVFEGAPGGDGATISVPFPPFSICYNGGDGGNGLLLQGNSEAKVLDTALLGGAPGAGGSGCAAGTAGAASLVLGGTLSTLPGTARGFEMSSPARELENVTLSAAGVPGDVVFLLLGFAPDAAYLASLSGSLLVKPPGAGIVLVGTVPAAGALTLGVPIPTLLPSDTGLALYAQALFGDSSGVPVLGPSSSLLVLSQTL